MRTRPTTNLQLTVADKAIETLGWVVVVAIWLLTLTSYANLLDSIPVHYNFSGEADKFGGKASILVSPIVATVLFIGLTILNKFPHLFNYPTGISSEDSVRLYRNASRLVRYLKLILVIIFGLSLFQTIRVANGQSSELGAWFLPLALVLIFLPIACFLPSPLIRRLSAPATPVTSPLAKRKEDKNCTKNN